MENEVVGKLYFFTRADIGMECDSCDCADPGTGGDTCFCEDA